MKNHVIKTTTWEKNSYFGSKIIPTVQQNGKNCMSENKQSITIFFLT
jgi:hypothetical protein